MMKHKLLTTFGDIIQIVKRNRDKILAGDDSCSHGFYADETKNEKWYIVDYFTYTKLPIYQKYKEYIQNGCNGQFTSNDFLEVGTTGNTNEYNGYNEPNDYVKINARDEDDAVYRPEASGSPSNTNPDNVNNNIVNDNNVINIPNNGEKASITINIGNNVNITINIG